MFNSPGVEHSRELLYYRWGLVIISSAVRLLPTGTCSFIHYEVNTPDRAPVVPFVNL